MFRWKPFNSSSQTKNILITGHTDGIINHWHVTSKKIIHSFQEKDNEIYTIDYQKGGSLFCTAGRDGQVRLYDENKMSKFQVEKNC